MLLSNNESESISHTQQLWLEGDWQALMDLPEADEGSSALYNQLIAAAYIQVGNKKAAKNRILEVSKENKELFSKLLLSGLHNQLARARFINGDVLKARCHTEKSFIGIIPDIFINAAVNIRNQNNLKQLGVPDWLADIDDTNDILFAPIHKVLKKINKEEPENVPILIALAEIYQRECKYDDAIRYWQELASTLQEKMPQSYYDRLDEAYQNQKSFPLGKPEEEVLYGDYDKHKLLKVLHDRLKPRFYLEIGVQTGKSLKLAKCNAIGIDPMPRPNIKLQKNHTLLRMTSDDFFAKHSENHLKGAPDLVFIDGMHLYEYALRDFLNVERYADTNTLVVIDDIFPGHPAQAERQRRTRAWTGDVWKLPFFIEEKRKNLKVTKLDIFPTGLMIIEGFDKKKLEKNSFDSKIEFTNEQLDLAIKRKGSIKTSDFLNNLSGS